MTFLCTVKNVGSSVARLPDILRRLLDWMSSCSGSKSKMEPGSLRHTFRSSHRLRVRPEPFQVPHAPTHTRTLAVFLTKQKNFVPKISTQKEQFAGVS